MTTAHDNEADEPSELVTIECHGDAAREALELAALAALELETKLEPEPASSVEPAMVGACIVEEIVELIDPDEAVEPEPTPTPTPEPEPTPTGIVEHVDGQRITFTEDGLHVATIWQPARDKDGKAPDFANWYTVNNAGTTGGKSCIALARVAIMKELER